MGLRFSRRISIIPGLRVNVSRSGPSLSIGHRGGWMTFGPRGRRVTLGLPGTGLYWTERIPPAPAPHAGHRAAFIASFWRSWSCFWSRFHASGQNLTLGSLLDRPESTRSGVPTSPHCDTQP
jgi:hypothetical protein